MNTNRSFAFQEERPGFPWPLAHTESWNNSKLWKVDCPVPLNYSIPMDWHHMMTWSAIRDSWSAVITSGQWDIIENWLGLLAVDDSGTRCRK